MIYMTELRQIFAYFQDEDNGAAVDRIDAVNDGM